MQDVLAVVTVVVVGVMVGVEFAVGVFLNPILNRIPNDAGLSGRSDGARVLGRVMPVWYISAVVLAAVWTALAWGDGGAGFVAAGVALLVASVVMSLLVLVPINSRAVTWADEGAPEDWKEQAGRWDRWHHARVGVIVLGFASFAVALV